MLARTALCVALLYTQTFAQTLSRPIELMPEADGSVLWNGVAVDDAVLKERLALIAKQQPMPEIHILPNRAATYRGILHILTMMQPYGFKLGLVGAVSDPKRH